MNKVLVYLTRGHHTNIQLLPIVFFFFFFFGHDFSLVPNILQTVTFYTRFLQLGSYR